MSCEVPEQIAAQVAGDADKGGTGNPAGKPPQEIIRSNQARQKKECRPSMSSAGDAARPPLNVSTRILTPYCAPTEQVTAATTAVTITAWGTGRAMT